MSTHERSLIGSVFERTTPRTQSTSSPRFNGAPGTGFPTAQHRFKSAFARAREEANVKGDSAGSRYPDVPSIMSKKPQMPPSAPKAELIVDTKPVPTDTDALLRQINEENARTIARMSDDEIETERRAILEQLGEGAERLLKRVQEARQRKEVEEKRARGIEKQAAQEVQSDVKDAVNGGALQTTEDDHDHKHAVLVASPIPRRVSDGLARKPSILRVKSLEEIGRSVLSPLPAMSSTRPSSRTSRRLRFAEVTPDDVHVYESAPVSPKRTVFALPPPPDTKDGSIVPLGTFRKEAVLPKRPRLTDDAIESQPTYVAKEEEEPEEGTPEYIRRRFFPSVPANDPSIAWMNVLSPEAADPSAPRFDLHGSPIPTSLSVSLPSHLGLHHHAEGSRAGYTIDDIFLLARSTVPAQRASMLGILAKIAHRLGRQVRHLQSVDETVVFAGQEGELRKRILAAGLAAIDQIGSLGARAVEVVWECLVEWDQTTADLEGVELAIAPDIVSSLQLDYLLPQITDVLSHAALPSESLAQLLALLHWLAQQSNQVADVIVATPRLVPTILNTFLLTPIPPKVESKLPNPLALQILITFASASRSNASALLDPADALLRFVTPLPPSSTYPPTLATTLLTYTLRFYATLASYGLYSHVATTASQLFASIGSYVLSSLPSHKCAIVTNTAFRQLRVGWTSLVESWIACATNPHATSPPHEVFWSQVCAWGWATDVWNLKQGLGSETPDWPIYAAIWDAEAAWLEGARINGIRGGEEERGEALYILKGTSAINGRTEFEIVRRALETVHYHLQQGAPTAAQDGERVLRSLASAGNVLASALRLWLACLPPLIDGSSLSTPPFALPWSGLSTLSAALVRHPIWSLPTTLGAPHLRVCLRPLTRFVIHFHRVSRHIPGTTPQLWFAQALVFLPRLLPGDESYAFAMLDSFRLVTPQFVGADPAGLPPGIHMDVLRPFFEYTLRPEKRVYVAPLRPNTESISRSTTLRLSSLPSTLPPGPSSGNNGDAPTHTFVAGLPLTCDFLFTPLTHLLRSGTSPVFPVLPANWTASEVDVVRATLLLAYAARSALITHGLDGFAHSAAEVVFACMRVCMLEHGVGVGTGDLGVELEVFRDAGVEQLMAWLLEPFTVHSGEHAKATTPTPRAAVAWRTLEDAAMPYLGATPFYQFYTDLVALYGAVSFGHPTFAALVVAPLAMQYAVDYRQALWCGGDGVGTNNASSSPGLASGGGGGADLSEVVRSVRISIEDVVCTGSTEGGGGDPREYLYPIERDVGILGAYVAALVARDGGGVQGFLRLVAVHHVACMVWEDMGPGTAEEEGSVQGAESGSAAEAKGREGMRAGLLKVVLVRGESDVVRDMVLYRQRQRAQGAFVWPPACYRGGEGEEIRDSAGWREQRFSFIKRTIGEDAATRVGSLLVSTM